MLTCQQMTELVTDYVERRLPFADRVRFQMHLGMCRHCREYLRQIKLVAAALGELRSEDVPPMPEEVATELLARFRTWKGSRARADEV
jgi:predicted anti-sigma-YlaC factor YlaD